MVETVPLESVAEDNRLLQERLTRGVPVADSADPSALGLTVDELQSPNNGADRFNGAATLRSRKTAERHGYVVLHNMLQWGRDAEVAED